MLFEVLTIHPIEYGGVLLIGPTLKSTLLLGKISSTFGMGQINFCVTLLSAQ